MASIHEKKNFFVLLRHWDTKTVPPEVYKLQNNDPRNKYKAKIHKDDGLLGVKFTFDKTISEFILASEKIEPGLHHKLAKFGNVLLSPYQTNRSKCSTRISPSLSTQKLSSRHKIVPWLRTSC